jgi:hypothetical protein
MENIVDLITYDESPSEISDAIKDSLFARAAEKIENIKPDIAASLFVSPEYEEE